MKKVLIVLGIIFIFGLLYIWSVYNNLVTLNEEVNNQWAQVETQYQRRFDLIPNLVESVKGVMNQEQQIFTELAKARSNYSGAKNDTEKVEATNQVESSLSRLLVIMENYPELKSSETVQTLMSQLEGTENRINVERKRYNDNVKSFNILTKRFPTNIMAGMLGFEEREYFNSTEGAENAPKVEFTR